MASEDGDVFVVKAGRKFELLATNSRGKALMATPAISDGMLILRAEDQVYATGPNPIRLPSLVPSVIRNY